VSDLALYRKYRSRDFTEVIGQDHIVTTLLGAIEAGRISHAYLFTGPRGVGKTSVARLLAKTVNKDTDVGAQELDIIEIDAASNRSIDSIRELREKVNLAPSVGKYKIYIIDEVHMLTTEAFNALLKTLEEPPSHVIFILATTESHKVPDTIISRTQRFSFKPIATINITKRLEFIAKKENISIDIEALEIIAESSRGSFRDAISMLDQVSGGKDTRISISTVRDLLGYSDTDTISEMAVAMSEGRVKEVLKLLDRLNESGVQAGQLITQLITWWRELILVTVETKATQDAVMLELSKKLSVSYLSRVIDTLIDASKSPWANLSLEVALIKLTTSQNKPAPYIEPLMDNIKIVEPAPVLTAAVVEPEARIEEADDMSDVWPKVLAKIKTKNPSIYALLQSSRIEFNEDNLLVWTKFSFHRNKLMEPVNRGIIEDALAKVYGRPILMGVHIDTTQVKSEPQVELPKSDLENFAIDILGGEYVD
jgi:DNA polymerase-3 subunit gamma/tau